MISLEAKKYFIYQYNQLDNQKLISELLKRDNLIEDIENSFIQGNSQGKIRAYRQKLQQQIQQNQKAIRAFGDITETITQIINYVETTCKKQNININQGNKKKNGHFHQLQVSEMPSEMINGTSEINCLDQMIEQSISMFESLKELIQGLCNSYAKFKKQKSKKQQNLNYSGYFQLQKQLQEIMFENKTLKKLIDKVQLQKKELLSSISNSISSEELQQLSGMSKQSLIKKIQQIIYRSKQLQKEKRQVVKNSQKQQAFQKNKYSELLQQVKGVRQDRRNSSMTH